MPSPWANVSSEELRDGKLDPVMDYYNLVGTALNQANIPGGRLSTLLCGTSMVLCHFFIENLNDLNDAEDAKAGFLDCVAASYDRVAAILKEDAC